MPRLLVSLALLLALPLAAPAQGYYQPHTVYQPPAAYAPPHHVTIVTENQAIVPIQVPSTLLLNIEGQPAPPPVTVSPAALEKVRQEKESQAEEARQKQAEKDDALKRLEDKFDQLVTQMGKSGRLPPPENLELPPPIPGIGDAEEPPKIRPRAEIRKPVPAPPITAIAAVLKTSCYDCHTSKKARGDVVLFNDLGQFEPSVSMGDVWAQVEHNDMPPGNKKKVPAAGREVLRQAAEAEKSQAKE